ncbi:CPBP family intramembrane metalloprotease [Haloferax mediterranei ATCC 33500]|uniref:CPBP family intramembrane metalloprotease n=1 Tax=Haloferax mediterranei (strain ATCC 33500 / DSM 1411 / JCM 8866 / NBRC 14739 / NCIMB 2177 / R-4) TaxID=523841 RepID=M0IWD5_HALMT|nr:type II CAAX endopeptidase family protein [Haloferax mediterranei]AHZ23167.1 hypothetical protein BM92_11200 [Haloferax mediterranei ATCC 33500]EMA00104.1 hypothetical protein C439_12228 [Haloferax mediterranei ATCC 33500]MDX5987473.1 type II CAAX endopeptidase family protein [Haloferax mediterranei ATCC 33500]QCQ73973.1 CPBP family intramembrane metalloprotease [Haloferax mediterranei ATCC 33500]
MSTRPSEASWFAVPNSRRGTTRLFLAVFAVVGLLYLFTFTVVVNPWVKANVNIPLYEATGGFLRPELLVYLGGLALVLAILRRESLRPSDVGLDSTKTRMALRSIVLVWVVAQGIIVAAAYVSTGTIPGPSPTLSGGPVVLAGLVVTELAGNSLFEEVVYRGFLAEQVRLYVEQRGDFPATPTLGLALLGSQSVFALVHVPVRLYQGATPTQTLQSVGLLFVLGVLFALVYYRTGNLLLAVGVHTLNNVPLFALGGPVKWPIWVATGVVLSVWPRLETALLASASAESTTHS